MYGLISSHSFRVYIFAILASITISMWSGISGSVINTDGICYLTSAESLSQGLSYAMHLCGQAKWPFYPVLIAGLVSISKFSFAEAAYFLNALFSIISVVVFIRIVSFLSEPQEKKQISLFWFAAIVILFSNEFNSVKYYIIRDHGFWAFYLLSLLMLLYFFQYQRWFYSIAWFISLSVATLFRIEGAIFLMLLPFLTFFDVSVSWNSRLKRFFKLNLLPFLVGSIVAGWAFFAAPENLGRLGELSFQVTHGLSQMLLDFNARANNLSHYVLSQFSARYSVGVLLITLIVWYVMAIIKNVSFVYAILAGYAWFKNLLKAPYSARLVLWGYVVINILVTSVFLAENMFLSKRYLIALSLIIMIWVPFALQHFYLKWQNKKPLFVMLLMIIFLSSLGGIFEFGYSKNYIHDAGTWLAKNTPTDSKIFSNDIIVMYYSDRFGGDIFNNEQLFKEMDILKDEKWRQYDYIALRVGDKENLPLMQALKDKPMQVFANKRGDQVIIYKNVT